MDNYEEVAYFQMNWIKCNNGHDLEELAGVPKAYSDGLEDVKVGSFANY